MISAGFVFGCTGLALDLLGESVIAEVVAVVQLKAFFLPELVPLCAGEVEASLLVQDVVGDEAIFTLETLLLEVLDQAVGDLDFVDERTLCSVPRGFVLAGIAFIIYAVVTKCSAFLCGTAD